MATHADTERSLVVERHGGYLIGTLTVPGSVTTGLIRGTFAKKLTPGTVDVSEWTGAELSYFVNNCFENRDTIFAH
jgi:hypothetical protein